MKDLVYEKPFGMLIGKKQYCPMCGGLLEIEKVKRTVTDGDRDYPKYHERGTYPRRDVSVTSHRYKCSDCKFRFTYEDQMIVSMIQRKLKKTKLSEDDVRENYSVMSARRERKNRVNAIISRVCFGLVCSLIFWFMIGGTPAASNLGVHVALSLGFGAALIGLGVFFAKFRKNAYTYDEILRLERLHTYSRSNKRIVARVERCYCFHCMKAFPSSEILDFLKEEDTALCPDCGVDAILPDISTANIDQSVLNDMHEYWF